MSTDQQLEAFRDANRDRRVAELWGRLEKFRAFRERTAGTQTADREEGAVEELLGRGELLAAELVLDYFEQYAQTEAER